MPEPQQTPSETTPAVKPPKKHAPTLYIIIVLKLLKGVVFLVLACILYSLSDHDLQMQYKDILEFLRLNPDRKFWTELAMKIGDVTNREVIRIAIGTSIYSLFALVEGVGLIFRVKWVGWMTIIESAFFVPIEIHELMRDFHWFFALITCFNIFIVWYLYQNRERLFHHAD